MTRVEFFKDDWRTVNADKQAILQPLLAPLVGTGGGGTGGTQIPPSPSLISALADTQQVSLSWNSSADRVRIQDLPQHFGNSTVTLLDVGNTTAYIDKGLTNGTTYSYAISAYNSAGESARSAQTSATPSAPLSKPGTPANGSNNPANGPKKQFP